MSGPISIATVENRATICCSARTACSNTVMADQELLFEVAAMGELPQRLLRAGWTWPRPGARRTT